jgi:hypothetical protein
MYFLGAMPDAYLVPDIRKAAAAHFLGRKFNVTGRSPLWQVAHVPDIRRRLGDDWWPYGLGTSRHVLEAFLRDHYTQGLSQRLLTPEEQFAPDTLEAFKI